MKARKLLLTMTAILGGVLLYFFVGLKVQSRLAAALDRPRACPAAFSWVLERPRRIHQEVPQVLDRIELYPGSVFWKSAAVRASTRCRRHLA